MATILFVHPVFLATDQVERELAQPYFPLGLLYLAGYVRQAGHTVAVFDGTFEPDEATFDDALVEHRPDVVGISALQPSRGAALRLATRAASAGGTVILGGPDPTRDPATYLADPSVDLVVHHEGEETVVALADRVDAGTMTLDALTHEPGIAYRQNGQIVITPPRPPIEDLDALPLPARDLIDFDRYLDTWEDNVGYSSAPIATSRGCPFGCSWCKDSVHGEGFRQRSPESVAAEVHALSTEYGIGRLRLVDDVDGIDRRWFERWADASAKSGTIIPFEPLNDVTIEDLPMLDVQDSL